MVPEYSDEPGRHEEQGDQQHQGDDVAGPDRGGCGPHIDRHGIRLAHAGRTGQDDAREQPEGEREPAV